MDPVFYDPTMSGLNRPPSGGVGSGDPNRAVGLDIAADRLTLAEVAWSPLDVQWAVTHLDTIALPDDAVAEGEILEDEIVADALINLLERHRLRSRNVAVSASGRLNIVRRIEMDVVPPERFPAAVRDEAEMYIPYDVSNVYLDAVPFPTDTASRDVLLVATPRSTVAGYRPLLQQAGLRMVAMDVDTFALTDLLQRAHGDAVSTDSVAILHVGADHGTLHVLHHGRTAFVRAVGLTEPNVDIVQEVQTMLAYYQTLEPDNAPPRHLYLNAAGGLIASLTAQTGLPVSPLDPFAGLTLADTLDRDGLTPRAAIAVGLGIRAVRRQKA